MHHRDPAAARPPGADPTADGQADEKSGQPNREREDRVQCEDRQDPCPDDFVAQGNETRERIGNQHKLGGERGWLRGWQRRRVWWALAFFRGFRRC